MLLEIYQSWGFCGLLARKPSERCLCIFIGWQYMGEYVCIHWKYLSSTCHGNLYLTSFILNGSGYLLLSVFGPHQNLTFLDLFD